MADFQLGGRSPTSISYQGQAN